MVIRSRWRINATGPTPRTKPMSARSRGPGPMSCRAATWIASRCDCRSRAPRPRRRVLIPRLRSRRARPSARCLGSGWWSRPEADATLAAIDALGAIAPQDLLLSLRADAGEGAAETAALARVAAHTDARITLECVIAASGDLDEELGAVARHVAEKIGRANV